MMALLTIVFLAALVGIAKPYIGKLGRRHFAGIAVAAFVCMVVFVPRPPAGKPIASEGSATGPADASASAAVATTPTSTLPTSKWTYSESKDEMRGTTSRHASITSENEIDLDFPYGEQRGEITVRRNPESGLNIMLSVGKGQILCNSFTNTTMSVKFDNGPVQRMGCTGTSDGSSETAFFTNESRMLKGLRKAKRTVVEAEFFHRGRQQFVFETAGLKWK